ncbi:MAG: protocatechuate 3,4-dioxygenase subunit alpha [Chloroflexota bacterium]
MTTLKQSGSQTVGPFFSIGLIRGGENMMVQSETAGERIRIEGRVLDADQQPVTDAMVEIWQADAQGIYNHPQDPRQADADSHFSGFGRSATDDNGVYFFDTIRPGVVPFDEMQNQAPHLLVRVFMRGTLLHAVTRLYFSDEAANDNDPVLSTVDSAEKALLIAQRDEGAGTPKFHFDIRMQGEQATPFFEP